MIRMLLRLALHIAGNAIGLWIASLLLSDMSLEASGFIIAVLIFSLAEIIVQPTLMKMAIKNNGSAIQGSTALITTFIALVITDLVSDGLSISGVATWLLATLIVWLATMLAGVILPLLFLKEVVQTKRG